MPSQAPRRVAFQLLRDWEAGEVYAADLIQGAVSSGHLAKQDRALVQSILYAAIRHRSLIDHFLKDLATGKLDPKTRRILRLGLAEALFLDTAPHALVNEFVKAAGWAKGIVNAILRRAIQEKAALLTKAEELPPPIRWSIPKFLWKRWRKQFGDEDAQKLAAWCKHPSEVYLRLNPFHQPPLDPEPGILEPLDSPTGFYRVSSEFDPAWVTSGAAYAQDPSTDTAIQLLDPQAGDSILDACAAPGGKTFALVASAGGEVRLYATDRSPDRLQRMQGNLARLGIDHFCETVAVDWASDVQVRPEHFPREFDKILLDVPCSNTGVIRRRIDVPWRLTEADFESLHETQSTLLHQVSQALRPGGKLVYSTCSLDAAENTEMVAAFLDTHPGFRLVKETWVLPWIDGFDGAYAAYLERK